MPLAPIIIFAFNRLDSLKKTVESLQSNPEAKDSDLFIFIDGPRNEGEKSSTVAVRDYSKSVKGFKSLTVKASESNKGLGTSIISGVSEVIDKFGSAIVLEDDLELQPNFLSFMNQGLDRYKDYKDVFSICGYTNKVKIPKAYNFDAYFCVRSSSWGWATWKDRWDSVDWELEPWEKYKSSKRAFNRWGGSDCFGMLEGWKFGRNKSWAIRFCFSQFLQNKLSLFPVKSLVANNGFDGTGTNCKKWSRFKFELMSPEKIVFSLPTTTNKEKSLCRAALKYHSVPRRVYSKAMYILTR